ncbi:MAG: hypothetical protein Q4D54_03475 [Eubacteriales bacterium]|nr:hypothetical protein [Eubacteriales bacterium]
MGFQSINEIEQFRFDDCVICELVEEPDKVELVVDALIVCRNNSQNTNFTESYADTAKIRFAGGKIAGGIKDGFKYYDANEVLLSEVPDTSLDEEALMRLKKQCAGAYLYDIQKEQDTDGKVCFVLSIEFIDEEEQTMGESYRLFVPAEKVVVNWERYLNRVQA